MIEIVSDIETSLAQLGIITFQLKITESREANVVREKLLLSYESSHKEIDHEALMLDIYNRSLDLKDTISFDSFKKNVELQGFGRGEIPRNVRTGKLSLVLDQRR